MAETPRAGASGTWPIGDRSINRLGFGAMRLPGPVAFGSGPPSDRSRSIAAVRRAVELGVNHVDTAAFYFSGTRSANELINSALTPYPDDLLIATKVGPSRDASGQWAAPAGPDQLRGQVEENLRQLGLDHLDLVYLRVQDREPLLDRLTVLAELQREGLIGHLGVSGVSPVQLTEALATTTIVAVQNRYGLGARRAEDHEVLRLCLEHGTAFIPFFAIAGTGGHRGATATDSSRVVTDLAESRGVSPAAIRLAWTLHQGPHVLAIPGSGNPAHVSDNVAAGALELSVADLERLGAT